MRWKMAAPDRLVWKCWNEHPIDPLTLIYNKDSDDTHLLNAFGATVLKLLEQRSLSMEEILAELSKTFPDHTPGKEAMKPFLATMTGAGILTTEP